MPTYKVGGGPNPPIQPEPFRRIVNVHWPEANPVEYIRIRITIDSETRTDVDNIPCSPPAPTYPGGYYANGYVDQLEIVLEQFGISAQLYDKDGGSLGSASMIVDLSDLTVLRDYTVWLYSIGWSTSTLGSPPTSTGPSPGSVGDPEWLLNGSYATPVTGTWSDTLERRWEFLELDQNPICLPGGAGPDQLNSRLTTDHVFDDIAIDLGAQSITYEGDTYIGVAAYRFEFIGTEFLYLLFKRQITTS